MKAFDAWLTDLSTQPLPGGVAAAAVAAAMGAALVAKSIRMTLRTRAVEGPDRLWLEETLALSGEQRTALLRLADADEEAYGAVLRLKGAAARSAAGRQAWEAAIDVPLQVAEACRPLVGRLPRLRALCKPALRSDLETGGWLLEAGSKAALLAARSNVDILGKDAGTEPFWARIEALTEDGNDD